MENILDEYAQTNALRELDCRLKLLLGGGCIFIGAMSPTPYAPLAIALALGWAILFCARIPAAIYLRLLAIPLTFAVTSCIVILLFTGGGGVLWGVTLVGFPLTVTTGSLGLSLLLMARTFGGMSALFFIALTTPSVQLFGVMRRLHLPQEFIDLSMLIYRFIFILVGEAIAIRNAQVLRHGYATFKTSVTSFSMLSAMLFLRSVEKGEDLVRAMDARCYDGLLPVMEERGRAPLRAVGAVGAFLSLCSALAILPGG
ncbi:MAG: cobalt ECF transporter T component CbiQ [Methanomicrobiales archaeon]